MEKINRARPVAAFALLACAEVAAGQQAPVLETVVVTGTADPAGRAALALVPGGASVIDIDDFAATNVASLADVLRFVPGVWAVSDSGSDNIFFSSRGSNLDATDYDMNGIKLFQDGLPVTSADGNNHNRVIDPLSARHATFARGANALGYGASTLGGAVNFVTPTARDTKGLDASVVAGSNGQRTARATMARLIGDRWDGLATVEGKRWEGYRTHNEQRRVGVYANAGWRSGDALETRFFATVLENDQALPGGLSRAEARADPGGAAEAAVRGDYRLDVKTLRLANRTTLELGAGRQLELGASLEEQALYHPIVAPVLVDPDGEGPAEPFEVFSLLIDTEQKDRAVLARYRHDAGRHQLLAGMLYARSRVDGGHHRNLAGRRNGLTTLVDDTAASLEIYAVDRWRLRDRLVVVLGAQLTEARRETRRTDLASGRIDQPHGRYSAVSPQVGLIAGDPARASFYANVSRLFEPPTNYQLEDNVAGGSAMLAPMRGTVVEIGGRGGGALARTGGAWQWDASLYRAVIDDEILSVEDPQAPGTNLSTNVDDTVHAGVEAYVAATLPIGRSGVSFEPVASVALNDFRFDGDRAYGDNVLPAAPDHVLRTELIFRTPSGFYVGPTFELVGKRYADFANTYEIGGHSLIGARAGWSGERLRVFGELRNVEDDRYVATHSVRSVAREQDAILNPGEPFSVYVGFAVGIE